MSDPPFTVQDIYLNPGEIYFGKVPNAVVRTLLGSCVAITLWHPKQRFGGMCHITMPTRDFTGPLHLLDTAYADEAMRYFMGKVALYKLVPREFQVGLYGGGKMFNTSGGKGDIGLRNINAMRQQLDSNNFRVAEKKVAGSVYRKLWLSLADGQVKLVEVRHSSADPLESVSR